jgi:hypothetical protein
MMPPPPKGDPPLERYIARITSELGRLDSGVNSVPRGGSKDEAQRITSSLMQIQGGVIDDLRRGSREIRDFGSPPFGVIPGIRNSLGPTEKKLQTAMNGWISQKQMVEASGGRLRLVDQLEVFSGAFVVFADAISSKVGATNSGWANSFKDRGRGFIEAAIRAYKR